MSAEALDLLEKMLIFDPNKRITGTLLRIMFQPLIYNLLMLNITSRFIFMLYFHLFTVDDALSHPYLSSLHDINDEPVGPRPFSFDFEQPSCTEEHIKDLIWRESVKFNPDPPCQ